MAQLRLVDEIDHKFLGAQEGGGHGKGGRVNAGLHEDLVFQFLPQHAGGLQNDRDAAFGHIQGLKVYGVFDAVHRCFQQYRRRILGQLHGSAHGFHDEIIVGADVNGVGFIGFQARQDHLGHDLRVAGIGAVGLPGHLQIVLDLLRDDGHPVRLFKSKGFHYALITIHGISPLVYSIE